MSCIPCCIYLVIGAIYYCMLKKHAFGAADYLVIAAISFLIQENDWPLFLVINGGIGTLIGVYVKHKNEKTIPFIPVIMLSVLLTNIVNILR